MRLDFWREREQKQKALVDVMSPGQALDRELADRILKGDREALARWLDRHLASVYGYVTRRLGPGQGLLAAEVTRATFEEAMRHLKPYARGKASTPMRLWLIRRAGAKLARRRGKPAPSPAGADESAQLVHVRGAMHAMSSRKETALALALFEGMPATEIAAALGTSQGRAMRLLRGALRSARSALEPTQKEAKRG
jgi:DNA-directed RNA polymerase specialized sigma24 family protein